MILWFLQAREEQPPEGVTPLCWLLATTVRIETIDEARRVLTWYLYRWRIERFHYVLKSGLGIERHQLATRQHRRATVGHAVDHRLACIVDGLRSTPPALDLLHQHLYYGPMARAALGRESSRATSRTTA